MSSSGWRSRGNQAPVTLLWHDYETTGLDKARDRPMQFAAIRTDVHLNIISEPMSLFCKVSPEIVPDPGACLLTGISPQRCEAEGLKEADFANEIQKILGTPGTCGVGYNTMRFDDEFTRNLLYRSMRDPYEREWANNNSRWDIVDLARAVHAFRPSVMSWPTDEEGRVSFRLEKLAEANNLPKVRAHDALSDVETTIALAKLIRDRAPEIFHHHFNLRLKNNVLPLFDWTNQSPLFHVSGLHGLERGCVAPIIPLAVHPSQANVIIVYDLMADPEPLLALPPEEIADRVFRAEKGQRLPLTTIYANRSPFLVKPDQLALIQAERPMLRAENPGLGFDRQLAAKNWRALKEAGPALAQKMQALYTQDGLSFIKGDPELNLYAGFASRADKARFDQIHRMSPEDLARAAPGFEETFENSSYGELLFRHRARNWPETLDAHEKERWDLYVAERITQGGAIEGRTLDDYDHLLQGLRENPLHENNPMLEELAQWGDERRQAVSAPTRKAPSP